VADAALGLEHRGLSPIAQRFVALLREAASEDERIRAKVESLGRSHT